MQTKTKDLHVHLCYREVVRDRMQSHIQERLPHIQYDRTFLQCAIQEADFSCIGGCTLSLKFPVKEKFSLAERLVFEARIQPLLQPVEDMVAVLYHRLLTANHCQLIQLFSTIFNWFQPVPTLPCRPSINWHIHQQPVEDLVAVLHHRLLTANHCQCVQTNPTMLNQFQPVSTGSNHSVPDPA